MVEGDSPEAPVLPDGAEGEDVHDAVFQTGRLRSSAEAAVRKRRRRAWYEKKRFLIPIGTGLVAIVLLIALAMRGESSNPAEAAVTHCVKDPRGAVVAQGVVFNRGDTEQDYRVTVVMIDGGGNDFAAGEETVIGVAPDGRGRWTVRPGSQPPDGAFRCEVASVEPLLP